MSRTVTLTLVDATNRPLGTLPPFDVEFPYWSEVTGVRAGARERFGLEVAVLRLVACEPRENMAGGAVTYLAQSDDIPAAYAGPVDADLAEHPLRARYARPGGPDAALAWAEAALGTPILRADQRRTWNLSAIWSLDTADGLVWLKEVPAFFAHEPVVLRHLAAHPTVPRLIAAERDAGGARSLLANIDGEDLYGCDVACSVAIADDMHALHTTADPARLLADGVTDWRAGALTELMTSVVARHGDGDPVLARLIDGLPDRFAALAQCGLPDTLVHGDLHSGNVRGTADRRTILDWGDAFVGSPAFDILRLSEGLDEADAERLLDRWAARWHHSVPGSDPLRAAALLRPVYGLFGAVMYDRFLANIEPTEYPYHASDVSRCLTDAAKLSADEPCR